jgi:hypothetical protein
MDPDRPLDDRTRAAVEALEDAVSGESLDHSPRGSTARGLP